jgi:hypothetical protein
MKIEIEPPTRRRRGARDEIVDRSFTEMHHPAAPLSPPHHNDAATIGPSGQPHQRGKIGVGFQKDLSRVCVISFDALAILAAAA